MDYMFAMDNGFYVVGMPKTELQNISALSENFEIKNKVVINLNPFVNSDKANA